MSMENVSLMGEGTISAGSYKTVKIMGEGRIIGGIEAEKLSVMGTLEAEEAVKASRISVSGEGKFAAINGEEFKIMGTAKCTGCVKSKYIQVMGTLETEDDIKANEVVLLGTLEAQDVETERFTSKGAFKISFLNANDIEIRLEGVSSAGGIGGENIKVVYPWHKKILADIADALLFKKVRRAHLKTETIEGDNIYLENTIAQSVKGNNVEIGPRCNIKSVEYKGILNIDSSSIVEKSMQV